jgi:hypothetical protein
MVRDKKGEIIVFCAKKKGMKLCVEMNSRYFDVVPSFDLLLFCKEQRIELAKTDNQKSAQQ